MDVRRAKLAEVRRHGIAYPNDLIRTHSVQTLAEQVGESPGEELAQRQMAATVIGRLRLKEDTPTHTLGVLRDRSGSIEIHVSDEASGKANHAAFRDCDLGDIVGVSGIVIRTDAGALALRAHELRLLAKALRDPAAEPPGPRTRELLLDDAVRERFAARDRLLAGLRMFMANTLYLEVETPILQPASGGAAGGFRTHHNALALDLQLRAAPDRFLKRLVVGGIEKVYELNRSFRDAGGDEARTPERSVMTIYCAYVNHLYMITLLERLVAVAAANALGATAATLQGRLVNLGAPYARLPLARALRDLGPEPLGDAQLRDPARLAGRLRGLGIEPRAGAGWGALQLQLFEALAAPRLIDPVFVTDFPAETCPFARREDGDDGLAEHFRLYLGGSAVAEGFGELTDPEAQAEALRAAGEHDYLRALEYGMPPLCGARLEIDRLAMLLTGSASPAEAILFPLPAPDC